MGRWLWKAALQRAPCPAGARSHLLGPSLVQSPGLGRTGHGGAGPRASPHRQPEHTPHSWGTKGKPPRADRTKGRALQNHCSPQPLVAERDPSRITSSPVPHHTPGLPTCQQQGTGEDSAVPAHAAPPAPPLQGAGAPQTPSCSRERPWMGIQHCPCVATTGGACGPKTCPGTETQLPQSPKNRACVLAEALTPCQATEGLRQALQWLGDPPSCPAFPRHPDPKVPSPWQPRVAL